MTMKTRKRVKRPAPPPPSPSPSPSHPLAHAIGGSVGSALALLLLYPLERARTQIQASAGVVVPPTTNEKYRLPIATELEKIRLSSPTSEESSDVSSDSWATCGGLDTFNCTENSSKEEEYKQRTHFLKRETIWECLCRLYERNELYKGLGLLVTTMATSNFVFFYAHEATKRFLLLRQQKPTLGLSLLASTLAGIMNVLTTNPLWVTNIRMVQQSSSTSSSSSSSSLLAMLMEMQKIARQEGIGSLWNGTWASLLLVSNPIIQFFVYEQLKALLLLRDKNKRRVLSPFRAFLVGALAKAVATVVTYPLQLSQVLLRLQQKQPQQSTIMYTGTWDCLVRLYTERGLFTGIKAKLLQTVLTSAFTFLTYEQILGAVQTAMFQQMTKRTKTGIRSTS